MRDTPGRNYIVGQGLSPSSGNFSISDSRFINGGTSLPGNDNQNDFSALFFTNPNVHVDRVTITHDNEPFNTAAASSCTEPGNQSPTAP